ncbi:hypothetical protein [Actinomadura oligospora]|uniref:hypothetical protein n=1 Tax=Actinomadura oligospora TaxID=111804 RepID=UPI0012FC6FD8|nr:hypothetical protein [Actinomadura oligospora]
MTTTVTLHGYSNFRDTTSGMFMARCLDSVFTSSSASSTGLGQMSAWTFHDSNLPAGTCTQAPPAGVTAVVASGLPYTFNSTTGSSGTLTGLRFVLSMWDGCILVVEGPGATTGSLNWARSSAGQVTFSGGNLVVGTANSNCDPYWYSPGDTVSANGLYPYP